MANHIIKYEYIDGVKLDKPVYWCGKKHEVHSWAFMDAQHAALAVESRVTPCPDCVRAIIGNLEKQV